MGHQFTEKRPIIAFQYGQGSIRLNVAGQRALGEPDRVSSTYDPRANTLTVQPDENGVQLVPYTTTFSGQGNTRRMMANGWSKERKYIGVAHDNTLTFSVDRYEEKQ